MTPSPEPETNEDFQKRILKQYLRSSREALVWKVEDLSEREARLPRVPSGTNLAGLIKHMINVEAGYLGSVVGRPWPTPEDLVPPEQLDDDPQADFYLTSRETLADAISLYRRVWDFTEDNIDALPLDTRAEVPWWSDKRDTTLFLLIVHTLADLARHVGHADILREEYDGKVGLLDGNTNMPGWGAEGEANYLDMLREIADGFEPGR